MTPEDTVVAEDSGPPYLFVDLYSRDLGANPPWSVLPETPGFYGAILKAYEGTQFNDGGWFANNWPAVREVGSSRYGTSWFRGAYLFLKFAQSGKDQADAYLQAVEQAGGWDAGDILPIVDVELGGEQNTNHRASAQEIIDCTTECAERLRESTGRPPMLYGRGAMRDLEINNRMGCDVVWNPSYTATMVRHGLEAWSLDEIALWQYCGDGTASITTLPHSIDQFGAVDISVYIQGAEKPTLERLRQRLIGERPIPET